MNDKQKAEAFDQIRSQAIKTNKKLKELKEGASLDKPIRVDIAKTTKAMFYEEVVTIMKQYKKE